MKKIEIKGYIAANDMQEIYEWFGYEAICPKILNEQLKAAGGDKVIIEINSPGGSVFAGAEMYTALQQYSGELEIHIVSLAGSAASVIAMARKCLISPVGMIMIHNASSGARGDYRVMDSASEMLKNVNQAIRNSYKLKTGMSDEELEAMMDAESWMSAEVAAEKKLVDGILKSEANPSIVVNGAIPVFDENVVEKVRSQIRLEKSAETKNIEMKKLELLKLQEVK